jgi:hypothetical protein
MLFEYGRFDGIANNGWFVGHFVKGGSRRTADVEVKWARHSPGPAGKGWSNCKTATTLSVLISGRFKMEFRNAPVASVELDVPGSYVIFGPKIEHQSTALEDSLFLTVRWPSSPEDCQPLE